MEKGRQRASFALVAAFALSAALPPSTGATTSSVAPTAGTAAASSCAGTEGSSTGTIQHLEYVLQDGITSVYGMDNGFKLIKAIPMPQDADEVRGATVAPSR